MTETISIEINKEIQEGRLATAEEIAEVAEKYGERLLDECSCGQWYCTSAGYEMRCALSRDNVCRWFIFSNSRCNP